MPSKENADYLMQEARQAGITGPKELANFMGQMQIESGGFTRMDENLHYSGARLLQTFAGRNGMQTIEQANAIAAGGPESVANAMYGGQWGASHHHLGNTQEGDGWKYHGRGYVQLTGRDAYATVGQALGLDLINHPELAADREVAAKIAIHYWQTRVVTRGHQHDVTGAARDINGGENGLADRRNAVSAWEHKLSHGYEPDQRDAGNLRQGAQSIAVRELQAQLKALGYTDAHGHPLETDGHFGPATRHAVEAFQRDQGLPHDGIAGPNTLSKLQALSQQQDQARQSHTQPTPQINDPSHPDHPMFQQAQASVHQLDAERGRTPDVHSDQLSGALVAAARNAGLDRIDSVWLSDDASRAFAAQGKPGSPEMKFASMSTIEAVNTPIAQSTQALDQIRQQQAQPQVRQDMQPQQPQAQRSSPAMSM